MLATELITADVLDHCTPEQLLRALAAAALDRANVYEAVTMNGMGGYWRGVARTALDAVGDLPTF